MLCESRGGRSGLSVLGAVMGLSITEIHAKREAWNEEALARRSSLKERERVIVNQTNVGTVSKATLGKLLRDGGTQIFFIDFSERIDTTLN